MNFSLGMASSIVGVAAAQGDLRQVVVGIAGALQIICLRRYVERLGKRFSRLDQVVQVQQRATVVDIQGDGDLRLVDVFGVRESGSHVLDARGGVAFVDAQATKVDPGYSPG